MGFRKDAYATIWQIKNKDGNRASAQISISRKNKQTGEYTTDFSGWATFFGEAASKLLTLKERDRIKLGDVDVSQNYNKEQNKTFTTFKVFSFEFATAGNQSSRSETSASSDSSGSAYGDGADETDASEPYPF